MPGSTNENTDKLVGVGAFANRRPKSMGDVLRPSQPKLLRTRLSLPVDSNVRLLPADSTRLSSFALMPGHELIDTNVQILGVVSADNHCEFKLLVKTGIVEFILHKRYSEFRDFRQQLYLDVDDGEGNCRNGACRHLVQELNKTKFPRRKLQVKFYRDDGMRTAKVRLTQLQHFLEIVLEVYRTAPKRQVRCCVNSQCIVLNTVRSFLGISDNQTPEWNADDYVIIPLPNTPKSTQSRSFTNPVEGSTTS